MALGAFTKAMPAMEKAVSLLPNDASVRRDYGVILYSRGKYAEARTEFTAALKADPSLAKSIEPFLAAIPAAGAAPGANPAMPATPEGDVAVPPTAAKN
jgi:tetratricopeptide (TPR) repeat protein